MNMPSARAIAEKYSRVTPGRSEDYEAGVKAPKRDWEAATVEAEENYEEGVKKAISRKAFGKGVKKCGTQRQMEKTVTKGVPHWIDGVSGAEDDMTRAMEPVVAVMSGIKLPKKYPKGDPRNIARVAIIGKTLRDAKEDGRI